MNVLLASPRGFCAGVEMAIECLEEAIRCVGPEIYVYHEILESADILIVLGSRMKRFSTFDFGGCVNRSA
ncbi:MAG: hypothetical protein H7Z17_07100 [Fuerstia sp.]|nr:hypothetical protein [Fuerstiella sp.]